MSIVVRPIVGDDPGTCEAIHGNQPCTNEAVCTATFTLPGTDVTVVVAFCREDWAEVVASGELDMRKTTHAEPPEEEEDWMDDPVMNGRVEDGPENYAQHMDY